MLVAAHEQPYASISLNPIFDNADRIQILDTSDLVCEAITIGQLRGIFDEFEIKGLIYNKHMGSYMRVPYQILEALDGRLKCDIYTASLDDSPILRITGGDMLKFNTGDGRYLGAFKTNLHGRYTPSGLSIHYAEWLGKYLKIVFEITCAVHGSSQFNVYMTVILRDWKLVGALKLYSPRVGNNKAYISNVYELPRNLKSRFSVV